MKDPIIIVGAGLSGLRAASLLIEKGMECIVLESRQRIGGRVLSSDVDGPDFGKVDLGPTWFWPEHEPTITYLVEELGLQTFVQHTEGAILFEQSKNEPVQRHMLPKGAIQRSVRLIGGAQALIDALSETLPEGTVELNACVTAIRMDEEGKVIVEAEQAGGRKKIIRAGAVILALPPRIVERRIEFSPSLPDEIVKSLLDKPTWMAGQAKAVAIYERPFWRENGLSGQVTSWAGPLQEIHDASPHTDYGALFGFFGIPANMRQELGEEKILELVIEQLTRLFGADADQPLSLIYKDWSIDSHTAVEEDAAPLTSFPAYGPPVITGTWEKKLIFAGTETSPEHGGHLEGALRSAERAVMEVMELK
ncbi:flavin monoamine oxidase family protein [Rossellomorea aquimaris]|uniref:flavin monoamine oxidase family protein n=1 Tax=Rossellomorea aquimaris TaxID=189382 RepID=UPI0005C90BBD|nr:FAD-dependent oxidoreductase [Rossellomorea aquimaris]